MRGGGAEARAPGAVLVGGYVNALGLVRSLAARGVPVAVVTTKPFDVAHRSRFVDGCEAARDLHERSEALVEALEPRASTWRGRVLVPTNDEAVAALAAHHDRLGSDYRLASPSPDAARVLLDKRLMMEAAREVGIDVPRIYDGEVEFPAMVKPLVASRLMAREGVKAIAVRDAGELAAARARLGDLPHIVTELVAGPDSEIVCHAVHLDERGDPVASATVRKLRQGPPGLGDARVAELVPHDAALHEATVALARRIGLTGLAVAEFKRGRFIEVNGRSVVYNALLRRGGLDVAALAIGERGSRAAAGRSTWVHLHPDVGYSLRDRIGVREFVAPYRRPPVIEAVWSR
ncbi:MAG TPA: hypothetical protein VF587_13660, partial [Solirubrobacteraceae bacterium]